MWLKKYIWSDKNYKTTKAFIKVSHILGYVPYTKW